MTGIFSCFCSKMCYELWRGAFERRESGLAKPMEEPPIRNPNDEIPNVNIHFVGSPPSPYELGDYDGWGHQVRMIEDVDDFADRDRWESVA